MRGVRLVAIGFVGGAAAAFLVSLLRKRRLTATTGYSAPDPAVGPVAVAKAVDPGRTIHLS